MIWCGAVVGALGVVWWYVMGVWLHVVVGFCVVVCKI